MGRVSSVSRRDVLRTLSLGGAAAALAGGGVLTRPQRAQAAETITPYDIYRKYFDPKPLFTVSGKKPLLMVTDRPPNLETPLKYLTTQITPNDVFFLRGRLLDPTNVDATAFRLKVAGEVTTELSLSLHDLKTQFEQVNLMAVNQCSGNSLAFLDPPASIGWPLGHGFMGCAVWTGVRVRDLLKKAGIKGSARDVVFRGMDRPVFQKGPIYEKALPTPNIHPRLDVDQTLNPDILLAYEMNGEPVPHWNGYPLRLVIPAVYGTYWVKWVESLTVLPNVYDGFWQRGYAYTVPTRLIPPGGPAPVSIMVPISTFNVKSVITSPDDSATLRVNEPIEIKGVAFDGGVGIKEVHVSFDGGQNWHEARLGRDMGKYAWRLWTYPFPPRQAGKYTVMARAVNLRGESQPMDPAWMPQGYMYNAVDAINLYVA